MVHGEGGGILGRTMYNGDGSIAINNCYNTGDIEGECSYIGGIVGNVNNMCYISDCYTTGAVRENGYQYSNAGSIIGYRNNAYNINITNCYYLENIEIVGRNTNIEGIPILQADLISQAYEILNKDNVWIDKQDSYPRLKMYDGIVKETMNLNVKNTLKRYSITTEIVPNSEGQRTGGTITGEYTEWYKEKDGIRFVENVSYGNDSTRAVEIKPDNGYLIKKITINNEDLDYTLNADGTYKIPEGYFENVKQDFHIAVIFEKADETLIINKVDSDDNTKALQGARFRIEQIEDDRPPITNEVGSLIGNGPEYNVYYSTTGILGSLTNNGTYYFTTSNGTYIPNNSGVHSSVANSYIPIDLTGKSGNYEVIVNAGVSSESSCDYGYATISQSTTAPAYNSSTGQFMKISGNVSAKAYSYTTLQGGNKYYLHLGYRKDSSVSSGNDRVTINSIDVYQIKNETFNFREDNGKYISSNQRITNCVSSSYIPIDLTNRKGKYDLTVNAEVSSQVNSDYGYATITKDTSRPAYNSTNGRFIYISGTQSAKDYTTVLDGGYKYYLHLGYRTDGSGYSGTDTFTVNSVKLSLNTSEFYKGEFTTNNKGQIIERVPLGKYRITELRAPNGYILDNNPKEVTLSAGNCNVVVENKKIDNRITIYKKDKNTKEPIPNTKFVIYSLNEENKEDDFAKDYDDNYLGTKEGDKYVLTTDENGQINVRPKPGMYKAVEIESAEGYFLEEEEYLQTSYFKIENPGIDYEAGPDEIEVGNPDLVINNLEDLVRLSNAVNSGNSYEGKTIVLARDLDFNEDSSYNNPNDTSFGDYNGNNNSSEGIKQELTTGIGFKAIGINEDKPFKGTFDGKGHEIRNIHMNINDSKDGTVGGLFAYIESGKILNLGLVGGDIRRNNYSGDFAYKLINSEIRNCYNKIDINKNTAPGAGLVCYIENSVVDNCYNTADVYISTGVGGIVYNATNSTISNCYNTGNISSSAPAGGIVYSASNTIIKNCHNNGSVSVTGSAPVGGIVYYISGNSKIINSYNTGNVKNEGNAGGIVGDGVSNITISNCYNKGDVTAKYNAGGIVATNVRNNCIISNCYNTGKIYASSGGPAGGLAMSISDSKVTNCYNTGKVIAGTAPAGGLAYGISNSKVVNCYNTGDIKNENIAGGIASMISSNSKIINCYNIGNVEAKNPAGGLSYSISDSEVLNFYNTGIITSSNNDGVGGIAQSPSNSKFTNCYYLNTTAEKGIYNQDDISGVVEAKTEEEMKSEDFAKLLNKNIKNINSETPLFKWNYKENAYPELDGISVKKEMTFINEKAQKVIVHHYLEGTGPEYGNDPITFEEAPDEELVGKLGEEYTSIPHMDIPKHTLIKDETGEYVIPENASGEFTEEVQHVYYYYNKNKVNLTVHHYLEGTENKVPLGQNEQGEDRFAEDEHSEYDEGDHYKTKASEEVLQKYELVEVVGDEEKDIMQDEVVIYYYKIKSHEITTRVEIPEGRSEDEKGGQISGEGEKPYETVDHEKSSIKDITITPDAGYRVKQIRLVSTNEEGNTQESIIYIDGSASEKEEAENAEITYTQNSDGTITLTKFENMTEDKEIIVVFEKNEGRLIVHHYIEGTTEKIYDDQITIKPVGTEVETAPVKVGNYVLVEEPEDRNAIITKETQEKTYYYQEQYKITTEVIKHSESYKDGTTKNNVKGGQIESEGKESHELVLKNRPSTKTIEITPDSGYEVVGITIKDGKDAKEGTELDFEQYKEKDANGKATGKIILPDGLFPSMQSDKHIQVEFRKKTKVIVKYLEEPEKQETEDGEEVKVDPEKAKVLSEQIIINGHEGQDFETVKKAIPNYKDSELGITDEKVEKTNPDGIMYADEITVIYWYTRVPSGIIVRHIETNEKAEEKEIESKLVDGLAGLEQPTTRNKYDKYIPVDRKEENKGNTNENITIMSKDQNSKTLTFAENETLEVWYFYEKEYNVTTEVKPHEEKVLNEETKEYETVLKDGGTISKRYEKDEQGNDKLDDKGNKIETVYEKILSRGDSKEEIEIKPDDGYRIKTVIKQKKVIVNGKETSEDEKVFIENMIKEDGSVILPEGQLTDVQNDYNIVVEFERIPAKVIVEYKDAYTKETIHEDKEILGFVNDKYNESRIEIESYIPADPEPENSEGKMTEETITVTYWYTKQFKITAEVKPHEEEEHNPETGETTVVQKDGGTIKIGEDLPEEIVTRGEDSTQKIIATPEDNYQIKEVTINGKKIEISNLIKEDGSLELPLFENMQEDKHIVVEFERIPAKVIVEHLDEETNEPIVDRETVDGYVTKDYETEPKDLKYYKLVEEKYPENYKGTMTEEDIVVKYYYKKLGFNMKVEKVIQGIKLNGQEVEIDLQNNKYARLEVEYKEIENTKIEVSYNIKVTNTEKVAGIAIVEEMIPEGFEFVKEESDEDWVSSSEFEDNENIIENSTNDRAYMLKTKELQPGEIAEYKVALRWKAENSNKGEKVNTAKIVDAENEPGYGETTLEDNEDRAIVEIRVKKTIQDVIDNIKDGKTDEAIKDAVDDVKIIAKDVITSVKTGDPIAISVIVILIAGVAMTVIISLKRKGINVKKEKHE